MPPPAKLSAPAAAAAQPRPRLRLLPRWLRRLPLPLLLLLSRLLDGLDLGPPAPACSTCSSRMGENPCFTMSSRSSRCSSRLRGEPRVKQRCQPPLDTRNQDGQGVGSGCTARSMRHEYGMLSQRTHLSSRRMPSAAAHAGEGQGCGRNLPSCGRAHLSCALRQQRRPSKELGVPPH